MTWSYRYPKELSVSQSQGHVGHCFGYFGGPGVLVIEVTSRVAMVHIAVRVLARLLVTSLDLQLGHLCRRFG